MKRDTRPAEAGSPVRFVNPRVHLAFTAVPDWLMRRRELSAGAKLCYARLARWYGADPRHPHVATVAMETLAAQLAVSVRQVHSYIGELRDQCLVITRRPGLGKSNEYLFPDHPWRDDTAPLPSGSDPDRQDVAGPDRKNTSDQERQNTSDPTGRILPAKREGLTENSRENLTDHVRGADAPLRVAVPAAETVRGERDNAQAASGAGVRTLAATWRAHYGRNATPAQLAALAAMVDAEIPAGMPGLTAACVRYAAEQGKPFGYLRAVFQGCFGRRQYPDTPRETARSGPAAAPAPFRRPAAAGPPPNTAFVAPDGGSVDEWNRRQLARAGIDRDRLLALLRGPNPPQDELDVYRNPAAYGVAVDQGQANTAAAGR